MEAQDRANRGPRNFVSLRPAVTVAVLLMAGVLLHRIAPHRPLLWVIGATLFTVAALFTFHKARLNSLLMAGAIVLIAIAAAQLYAYQFHRDEITLFAGDSPRLAEMELEIVTPPRVLTDPFDTNRALPPRQVATARAIRIRTWTGWTDASGELLVQITEPHPRLQARQRVAVLGMLQRPAPAMNPGQFDWANYYRDQRILASFQVAQASNIRILETPGNNALGWLREHARRLLAAGFPTERSLDHALLRALLLGDPDPQLRDVQEQFQRTGTSHHLAISGMHVAVLGGFVFLVCRVLCLSPRKSAVVSLVFVVVYGLAAMPSPPVVRSVLLCAAVGAGLISRRSIDWLQLLAVSVLAMLIYRPIDLYNAGFQLSFGTVLGMILLTPAVLRTMQRWRRDEDTRIARLHSPPSRWTQLADHADGLLLKAVAAGFVAWLVSMPLIAWHFEQLNPWAVPASLILAPVVLFALILGFLKVLLTLIWPGGAAVWVTLTVWPITWMRGMVDWLASWPRSDVPLPPPPWWLIVLYYACLLTMVIRWERASAIWFWRVVRTGVLLTLLWLPYESDIARRRPAQNSLRITLLAVGAGQCAVVEPPSGRVMLVDAGSSSLTDLVAKCLGPYLRHRGCTNVDTIILSHADYDHYSGAAEVAGAYQVREILTGAHFARHSEDAPLATRMMRTFDALQRPPRVLEPGQRIPLGRETEIEVLWPPKEHGGDFEKNDVSLVLRLTHAGRSILLSGDIEDAAMRELLAGDAAKIKADVLVAPHHGSSESLTETFVATVDPRAIVSSNDRTLSRRQVNFEGMIGARPLLRTHTSGAITIEIDANGTVKVTPFLADSGKAISFRRGD